MKANRLVLVLTFLGLTACAGGTTSPDSTQAVNPEPMAAKADICLDFGPQTPRDISNAKGSNPNAFPLAPESTQLNLCNLHSHTQAEHKGPGFSVFAGENSGFQCNDTASLTPEQLVDPSNGQGAFENVKPGDSIEVHWVYSSCDVQPGEGLGACLTDGCTAPLLRVEAQVFLVVNDPTALNFNDFDYAGSAGESGFHQPKALPVNTGKPIVFRGSTTGPKYNENVCSPLNVTWSVRPTCARVDITSLHEWAAKGNIFKETKSQQVRNLVVSPELLSPID